MTESVKKLQSVSLNDPVKIEVSTKFQTVDTLVQNVDSKIIFSIFSYLQFTKKYI